ARAPRNRCVVWCDDRLRRSRRGLRRVEQADQPARVDEELDESDASAIRRELTSHPEQSCRNDSPIQSLVIEHSFFTAREQLRSHCSRQNLAARRTCPFTGHSGSASREPTEADRDGCWVTP